MNVCLVSSYFHPYVGGIETYVSNLADSLARRGHDVTVYCSSRSSRPGVAVLGGVRIVRFQTPLLLYGAPIGFFPSGFFEDDYDVIHCNFPNPYFAAMSAWVGRLREIPTVLTWHNDLPAVTSGASLLVSVHDRLSPSYLNLYRTIIATTSAYSQISRTLRRYSRKVMVVSNGVDTSRFTPEVDGGPIRERYGLQRCHVVLFVGALTKWHYYKGLGVLIEAFARASKSCPLMRLLIVGSGELADRYASLARELSVEDKVQFAGRIDDEFLPMFYSASDVTVLPSRDSSEGFGLVLLEAMSCGRAVIGSSIGGIPELIRDGENGLLVEPNDPEALAAALGALYVRDEERLAMGRAGREFAELHDWRSVAASVESIYQNTKSSKS